VLKEKVQSAEAEAARAVAAAADAAEMRERVAALEQELERWVNCGGPDIQLNSPQDVARRINGLQANILAVERRLVEATAALEVAQGETCASG
jgi:hypothetical protein